MDMIGDADLNIDRETNSTPWLTDLVCKAAERGGFNRIFMRARARLKTMPFVKRGVLTSTSSTSTTVTTTSSTILLRTPLIS
jgi:hypothetical protein